MEVGDNIVTVLYVFTGNLKLKEVKKQTPPFRQMLAFEIVQ